MIEVIAIIVALAAVVTFVAYKYWTLGDSGAEFDLFIKRGSSIADPLDPHRTIELNLGRDSSSQGGDTSGSRYGS